MHLLVETVGWSRAGVHGASRAGVHGASRAGVHGAVLKTSRCNSNFLVGIRNPKMLVRNK